VRWVATNYPSPDFDWRCLINDLASTGARPALYGTGAVVIEDPDGLMTNYTDGGPDNLTLGREGKIHVPKVVFRESAPCSGFDPTLSPPWPMVPEDGANTIVAGISPAAVADRIAFEVADAGKASVSPAAAAASEQTLTLSGAAAGETEVRARLSGSGTDLAALGVSVKKRVTKSVCIHAVTEGNDDETVIPLGGGQPRQVCVAAGPNGVLDTTAAQGDETAGNTVTTGVDGICRTAAAGDDVQVIPVGQGKPHALCIAKGANGFVDSRRQGDDVATAEGVTAGPDGICNTLANHYDLPPANCPSEAELAAYLNEVWGKQANVWFSVTRSDCTVNYDLDRSGTLAYPVPPVPIERALEAEAISSAAKDGTVHYNIYYTRPVDDENGVVVAFTRSGRPETWLGGEGTASILHTSAHEVGHLLERAGHSTDPLDLMFPTGQETDPRRVLKDDWDMVNP
jgi:hypothetical protein